MTASVFDAEFSVRVAGDGDAAAAAIEPRLATESGVSASRGTITSTSSLRLLLGETFGVVFATIGSGSLLGVRGIGMASASTLVNDDAEEGAIFGDCAGEGASGNAVMIGDGFAGLPVPVLDFGSASHQVSELDCAGVRNGVVGGSSIRGEEGNIVGDTGA